MNFTSILLAIGIIALSLTFYLDSSNTNASTNPEYWQTIVICKDAKTKLDCIDILEKSVANARQALGDSHE